ncbi:hypothetical protein [Mycobacterium sp. AT1]|nr:hypothetical protein [Mycobacterium sp. AT1]
MPSSSNTAAGVGAGIAIADQPHMQNAINLVNQAINEVNLGIQVGNGQ